jgi:hypothetical protein
MTVEATGAARDERQRILAQPVEPCDGEAYASHSGRRFEDLFLAKKKSVASRPKPEVLRKTGAAREVGDRRGQVKGRVEPGLGTRPDVVVGDIPASAQSAIDMYARLQSLENPCLSGQLHNELLQLLFCARLKLRLARNENAAARHVEAEACLVEAQALLSQITRIARGVDPRPPNSVPDEGTTIMPHLPKSSRIGD